MVDIEEDIDEEQAPFLHIHWQKARHDDVIIVWNHEALKQLHKAVTNAITKGEWHTETIFCGDGEGYKIKIKNLGNEQLSDKKLPYSDLPY